MNVLDLPFIQCQHLNGQVRTLCPLEVISHAKSYKKVVGYPLDVVSGHRFLTAAFGWARSKSSDPCDFLNSAESRQHFCLFGQKPFYQQKGKTDFAVTKEKKVGYLFQEIPTGENWTGTRSMATTRDGSYKACLSCCARGLVRIPCFTTTGGGGFCPGLHGSPPGYIIPVVDNLLQSMLLSDRKPSSMPSWTGHTQTQFGVNDYLSAFTWMPRAVTLFGEDGGVCSICGNESSQMVSRIHFENNVFKSVGQRSYCWSSDPHVIYRPSKNGMLPANLKLSFQMDNPSVRGHNAELICDLISEDVEESADKDYVRSAKMGHMEVGVYGILISTNVIKGEFGYQLNTSTGRLMDDLDLQVPKKKTDLRSDKVIHDASRRLASLTQDQLEVLKAGSRRLPDKKVFEVFTSLYRHGKYRLVNKIAWSRVAFAYARHPVWGKARPDTSGWSSAVVRDDRFDDFMRACENSGCGVDWEFVIQQMDRFCFKVTW